MSYDKDLNPVLEAASLEELGLLVDIMKDKWTESFTSDERYKANYPNHKAYVDLLADEFRKFGGHTLVNIPRKEGPSYAEIVCDVAEALNVKVTKGLSVDKIEKEIFLTVGGRYWDSMSDNERNEWLESFGLSPKDVTGQLPIEVIAAILFKGGKNAYRLALSIISAVAGTLLGPSAVAFLETMLGKVLGPAKGPIGWFLAAGLLVNNVLGPAFRVTRPGVLIVAAIRLNPEHDIKASNLPINVK